MDDLIHRLKTRLYLPHLAYEPVIFTGLEHKGGALVLENISKPHKTAAILIPIIKRGDIYKIILTKRAGNLRKHGGQISFPGGMKDETDFDIVATALRETHEEIGIKPEFIEVLAIADTYYTRTDFAITPIIAQIAPDCEINANPSEVDEVFEVPIDIIFNPEKIELRDYHIRGQGFGIFTINYAKYQIWGISCAIIRMINHRIFDDFEL